MASRDDEFTAFAEAASSRLLNTAYLLCGDWHTAEDLTQTTLAKVYSAWHRITRKDAVHAYAKRTLLNTYFVDCRRTRRGEILKSTEDLPEHTISIRIEVEESKPFGIASYATKAALRNIRIRRLP